MILKNILVAASLLMLNSCKLFEERSGSTAAGASDDLLTAYIANHGTDTISVCSVLADGSFGTCAEQSDVSDVVAELKGIAVNPAKTHLYAVDHTSHNVQIFTINSDHSLTAVADTGSNFNFPNKIVFSPNGNFVFIMNDVQDSITSCAVQIDGTFAACGEALNTGADYAEVMTINQAGTRAYISYQNDNSVYKCAVSDGIISACADALPLSDFELPVGIVLNDTETRAYVVNTATIDVCNINVGGDFVSCTDVGIASSFWHGPESMKINPAGTHAYIVGSFLQDNPSFCPIKADGTFDPCTYTHDASFDDEASLEWLE